MNCEELAGYDPKVWNCLALVKPPKIAEPYRVMYESRRYLGWWYGDYFEFPEGFTSKSFTKEKVLFKPWDDDLEGVVCLSVEEAKVVNRALAFGLAVSESLRDQDDFEGLAEKIDKLIERADGKNKMFDFTFGQELERKLVEKSKLNQVTKVNDKLPIEEPKLIVLTLEEAKDILGWLLNSKWKWSWQDDLEFAEYWRKDWVEDLKQRIELVEKGNASHRRNAFSGF